MVMLETKISRISRLVGKELSGEEIEEILFDYGYEIEEIDGDNIKIELTPERMDLLSNVILSENLKRWIGKEKGLIKFKSKESEYVVNVTKEVSKIRPYIVGAIVKDCNIDEIEKLIYLQEKISTRYGRDRKKVAIGLYKADLINFPVTYDALEPEKIKFIPLDFKEELNGREILEKHPKGIKYGHLINKFERFPVLYDSKGKILSMPPIINSNDLGKIDEKTKNVFIEATGDDLKLLKQVVRVFATELEGEIYKIKINYPDFQVEEPDYSSYSMKIKKDEVNSYLGLNLSTEQIINLLRKMGFECKGNEELTVEIPNIRNDIIHAVDIYDEIARAYGYNNFELSLPKVTQTSGKLTLKSEVVNAIEEVLVGLNFVEVSPFSMTNEKDQYDLMRIKRENCIKIVNPLSEQFTCMRTWILPELLKSLRSNLGKKLPIKIFEVGDVLIKDSKKWNRSKNVTKLSFLICKDEANFTEGRQVIEKVLDIFDVNYKFEETKHESFIEGRVASILVNKNGKYIEVGFVGEVHPEVLDNFSITSPVVACEIDISFLLD